EFSSTEGVVEISSSSQDNMSMVTIEFAYDRNLDIAAVDVQNAVARVREDLPSSIHEPQVLKLDTGDRPVITLGVTGEDLLEARSKAEDVWAPELQRVDGVAAVDVFGGSEKAVVIELDRAKLEAYRIPFARVVKLIQTSDAAMPAGTLRTESTTTSFRIESRVTEVGELGRIPVTMPDGSRVMLSELGDIRHGSLDDDARFAIDGERAIAIQVFKTDDANTVEVVERVSSVVEQWNERYDDVEFVVGEEDASFTEQSVSNLLSNVWQALLLASIVVFLFIGRIRASLVAVVSMPLSYGLTFALMHATDTEFNMVTLSAVILAVGMVVDASVVVLENIIRRRDEDGLDAEEAAVAGTDEVRTAVLAGVGTTVIVLVPLLFLTGFVGKTFGPLARTLLFAFTSSVAVALVLVPVLSIYTQGQSRLDDLGSKLVQPFRWSMESLRDAYLWLLRGALRLRVVALLLAVGLFVGGVALIRHQGMEVLPKMDSGSFFVSVQTPSGSSLDETERVVREVEDILAAEAEVVKVQSQMGFEQGMKTFSSSGAQGPTQGFVTVTLTPRTEREESIWGIEQRVRDKLERVPGIRTVTVREMGNTAVSTTAAPIVVNVSGPDSSVLDRLGEKVVAVLADVPSVVEPTRNWRIDQKRVEVDVDEVRAGQLGLSPTDVGRRMLMGADGVDAGEFYGDMESTVPIRVRYRRSELQQPTDLLDFPVFSRDGGEPVPLRSVASLRETTGQELVTRKNFSPTVEVTALTRGRPLSFVTADVQEAMDSIDLPQDYELEVAGDRDNLDEARSKLGGAFAVALIAVYLLLVAQLRSFLHPLTIMGAVPLSLAGVGGALWLADKPVSMPVMIGMILLVGTVVNNSILLIDFVRQARERGEDRREALEQSVAKRFRPIMMTAISTTVGMIPLAAEWALGAERFSPLAIAVIGGLVVATFLTMIVIPVMYDLLDELSEWASRVWSSVTSRLAGAASIGAAMLMVMAVVAVPRSSVAQQVDEPPQLRVSVDDAWDMARNASHQVLATESDHAAARAREKEARGQFAPRVEVTGRASKLSEVEPGTLSLPAGQPGMEPQQVQFGEEISETYMFRASVSQPLFTGLALQRGYRASKRASELAGLKVAEARADVKLGVVQAYFELYTAQELVDVARESVALLEAHRDRVLRLQKAGRATKLDVSRVDSRLADAEVELEQAVGGARLAEQRFKTIIGADPDADIVLTDSVDSGGHAEPQGDPEALAVSQRPELEVARKAVEVKEQRAAALEGALWPHLYLQAGYTLANPHERYFPPRSQFDDSWDVSLVLSWSISSLGTEYFRAQALDHEAAAARQRVRHLEDYTELAVEKQQIELETARRKVAASARTVEAADAAWEAAVRSYKSGRASSTEVLETEVELRRAKAKLVATKAELQIARARLDRLLGR
ncbi:MAG: efflux RND transporter permease subunit, partial [Myxococcota bacterium]